MDLQDFQGQLMYFDEPLPDGVEDLLNQASEAYGDGNAEWYLTQAYSIAPANMTVLVAMYRFYYYQHRLPEAIDVAFQVMRGVARLFELRGQHRHVGVDAGQRCLRDFVVLVHMHGQPAREERTAAR